MLASWLAMYVTFFLLVVMLLCVSAETFCPGLGRTPGNLLVLLALPPPLTVAVAADV